MACGWAALGELSRQLVLLSLPLFLFSTETYANASTSSLLAAEQGLLIMPIYSDIRPGGGGTMIIPEALPTIMKHLQDHPEGLMKGFVPCGEEPPKGIRNSFMRKLGMSFSPKSFVEVTGQPGDVYV